MTVPSPDPLRAVVDDGVAENIDRLISLDMRGDMYVPELYAAARELAGMPLMLAGARAVRSALHCTAAEQRSTVALFTGFRIPPTGVPETDGVIGTAVLAHGIARATGAVPVVVCEPECFPAVRAALVAVGLSVAVIDDASTTPAAADSYLVPFGIGDAAADVESLLTAQSPVMVAVAVERPAANDRGYYHFAGGMRVEGVIAPIDDLWTRLRDDGVPTVAIGDFGNELGTGYLAATVAAGTESGAACGCGCGGGVAAATTADVTIACSVSDWGAYGLAAMLGQLAGVPEALPDTATYRRTVDAANLAGAIDGTSRLGIPAIDGIGIEFHARHYELIRDVVAHPNRPSMNNAIRRHRAGLRSERAR
ncbi:MAG: DUF4392 domain-containing protein [Streptosporangiales bacterium]|nr:DUF4392 domain-containing protein [Streptosporangiales bacterium]